MRDEAGEKIHFRPFDGWSPAKGKSVIAQVYPSIFRNRYTRDVRTADEQDACATARWLAENSARGIPGRYFEPPRRCPKGLLRYERAGYSEWDSDRGHRASDGSA